MSLANSCEYLTSDKLCLAVSGSEKAKSAREARCRNDEKTTCCYLCMFVMDCATPCRFLESNINEPQQVNSEKTKVDNAFVVEEKTVEDKAKEIVAACCSLCNVEMSQTRTKLRIDGWEGSSQKLGKEDSEKHGEQMFPVIVYLCPKCGKIEFKADEK